MLRFASTFWRLKSQRLGSRMQKWRNRFCPQLGRIWSDFLQVKTIIKIIMFQFRRRVLYACCALHCRFCLFIIIIISSSSTNKRTNECKPCWLPLRRYCDSTGCVRAGQGIGSVQTQSPQQFLVAVHLHQSTVVVSYWQTLSSCNRLLLARIDGQICDACQHRSVRRPSRRHIWKTKQDRPVITMEH